MSVSNREVSNIPRLNETIESSENGSIIRPSSNYAVVTVRSALRIFTSIRNYTAASGIQAARFAFVRVNFQPLKAIEIKRLLKLTGSWHLGACIQNLLPLLSDKLIRTVNENITRSANNGNTVWGIVLRGQQNFVKEFVHTIIYRATANLIEWASKTHDFSCGDDVVAVTIESLLKWLEKKLKRIDPDHLDRDIKEVSEELLKKFFPRGKDDFQMGSTVLDEVIVRYLWKVISKQAVPELLARLYKPDHLTSEDRQLLERPGGRVLVKASQKLANLLTKKLHFVSEPYLSTKVLQVDDLIPLERGTRSLLTSWMKNRLKNLIGSESRSVQTIISRINNHVSSFILKCLISVIKNSNAIEDEESEVDLVKCFFNVILSKIAEIVQEEDIMTSLKKLMIEKPNDNTSAIALLRPFTDPIFDLAGIKEDRAIFLSNIKNHTVPLLAWELFKGMEMPFEQQKEYLKQLCHQIYDPSSLTASLKEGLDENISKLFTFLTTDSKQCEKIQDKLWQATQTKFYVNTLKDISKTISEDIIEAVLKYLNVPTETILEFVKKLYSDSAEFDQDRLAIVQCISSLSQDRSAHYLMIKNYITKHLENMMIVALVNIVSASSSLIKPESGIHRRFYTPGNVILDLITQLHKHLENIRNKIHAIRSEEREDEKKACLEIFIPLSKSLITWAFRDAKQILPVPEKYLDLTLKIISEQVFPNYLLKSYFDLNRFIESALENRKQIEEVFNSNYPNEALRLMREFLVDFIPYIFRSRSSTLSTSIIDKVTEFLNLTSVGSTAASISGKIEENNVSLHNFLAKNLNAFASLSSTLKRDLREYKAVQNNWKFIAEYSEAICLESVSKIGHKINIVERAFHDNVEETDFLLKTLIKILGVVSNHFYTINRVKGQMNKSVAHKVSRQDMINGFRDELHSGVPNNLSLSEDEQQQHRIENFYKPLSRRILKLSGITSHDKFPLPDPLKNQIGALFSETLLPKILHEILDTLRDGHTINVALLNSFEAINKNVSETLDEIEGEEICIDNDQMELNRACGKLILQLIELLPKTATKSIILIDRIQNMTAENIGYAVRKKLQGQNIKTLVNLAIEKGLTLIHPGHFEGERGQERYVAEKVHIGPNYEASTVPADFHINLPNTNEAERAYNRKRQKDAKRVEKQVQHLLADTVNKGVENAICQFIARKWHEFQKWLDKMIKSLFGDVGKSIKHMLDIACGFVFFTLIGAALRLVLWPFYQIFWGLLYLHILGKAKDFVKDLTMPIHESCLFKVVDLVLDELKLGVDSLQPENPAS